MKWMIFYGLFLVSYNCFPQVSINNNGAAAASNTMLDIKSSNRGVQFPRMTSAERKAIAVTTADIGLMVFDVEKESLYMYDGSRWAPFATAGENNQLVKEKRATGISTNAGLGTSVSVSGDYAAAGSPYDSVNNLHQKGSVVIFQKINGNWIQKTKISSPDNNTSELFGFSVSLSGNTLAVGAGNAYVGGISQGAVYTYTRSGATWVFQQKLYANDGGSGNQFGSAVLLHEGSLYVGSPNHAVNGQISQGSVYVFNFSANTWSILTQLKANDGNAGDNFGTSIAAHNNSIVAGAPGDNNGTVSGGSAYVFIRTANSFTQQGKLLWPGVIANSYFGHAVAIENDMAIVGGYRSALTPGNVKTGLFAIFYRNGTTWTYDDYEEPYGTEPAVLDFGKSLILKNGFFIISASNEPIDGMYGRGAVYIYKVSANKTTYLYKKITDRDGLPFAKFGHSISFEGSTILIGSPGTSSGSGINQNIGSIFFGNLE